MTVTFERTVVHQRDGASYYEFRYCRITKKEREYHFRIHSAVGVRPVGKIRGPMDNVAIEDSSYRYVVQLTCSVGWIPDTNKAR